jgi:hypothetical protein
MAKLRLKKFECIETTSGSGSDSPYFVIFVGGLQPRQSTVERIRLGPWHDEVDSGEVWPVGKTVVDDFDLAVVICALIEEDGSGPDIGGVFMPTLDVVMRSQFDGLTANQTAVSPFIAGELRNKFKQMVVSLLGDDDLIQVRRVGVSNGPGEITLPFTGDGGRYRATFTVQ